MSWGSMEGRGSPPSPNWNAWRHASLRRSSPVDLSITTMKRENVSSPRWIVTLFLLLLDLALLAPSFLLPMDQLITLSPIALLNQTVYVTLNQPRERSWRLLTRFTLTSRRLRGARRSASQLRIDVSRLTLEILLTRCVERATLTGHPWLILKSPTWRYLDPLPTSSLPVTTCPSYVKHERWLHKSKHPSCSTVKFTPRASLTRVSTTSPIHSTLKSPCLSTMSCVTSNRSMRDPLPMTSSSNTMTWLSRRRILDCRSTVTTISPIGVSPTSTLKLMGKFQCRQLAISSLWPFDWGQFVSIAVKMSFSQESF